MLLLIKVHFQVLYLIFYRLILYCFLRMYSERTMLMHLDVNSRFLSIIIYSWCLFGLLGNHFNDLSRLGSFFYLLICLLCYYFITNACIYALDLVLGLFRNILVPYFVFFFLFIIYLLLFFFLFVFFFLIFILYLFIFFFKDYFFGARV